jgi:hypothetical protein
LKSTSETRRKSEIWVLLAFFYFQRKKDDNANDEIARLVKLLKEKDETIANLVDKEKNNHSEH